MIRFRCYGKSSDQTNPIRKVSFVDLRSIKQVNDANAR
jgi:hypothetical protein